MAFKDLLDRFKEEQEEYISDEAPTQEKPSFVFTDIHSEPLQPEIEEPVAHNAPVKVGSSDNDRIQMFEIDLGRSKVKLPDDPVQTNPAPEIPDYDTYMAAAKVPEPVEPDVDDDYEVDFGYSADALDDITFSKTPKAAAPKSKEPEPVVYSRSEAPAADDDEYYDSYEPLFEESYGPGSYFASQRTAPVAEAPVEAPAYEEPEPVEPVKVYNDTAETQTYTEETPRYENYRKKYRNAPVGSEPHAYENNIDDSVFLPDEGEAPMSDRRNRRRLTIAIVAILVAILLVAGAFLISHFSGNGNEDTTATSATKSTTSFERSVSSNESATTTTTEEDVIITGEDEELSDTTETTAGSSTSTSTSRRTSTTTSTTASTTSRTTTSRTTTSRTTRSTTSTTRSTTTTAATTASTTTRTTTTAPSPWDQVNR